MTDFNICVSVPQTQAISIGRPTNVTHHGHASTIEDAQSLIEKLMVGGGSTLPPPLLPDSGETCYSVT